MKRVALFSGSFNPIHIGHIALCNYIAEFADVDEVRLIVSPQNPLKQNMDLLDDNLRLDMLRMAVDGYPKFSVSDVEFHLPKPSYTYVTLDYLRQSEPDTQFILVMGADNLDVFTKWKNYQWIMDNFHIFVYPRLGYTTTIPEGFKNITIINAPVMEISSTFIRKAISEGKDMRFFMPNGVAGYIASHKLYGFK